MAENDKIMTAPPVRPGDSDRITREYLDSLLVEMRLVDSDLASVKTTLFGYQLDTPAMFGVIGGYDRIEGSLESQARATAEKNTVLWLPAHISIDYLKKAVAEGAKVIYTIKPYKDREKILSLAKQAQEIGAIAIASDIDHAYGRDGDYDRMGDNVMKAFSQEELKMFVRELKVPFLIKGVLSVQDALKCKEAGVAGILISHHHGIMDYAIPPLYILPKIREAVGKDYPVIADCSIERGADVFKALALGADGVCIARSSMKYLKEGKEGFCRFLDDITGDLRHFMNRTGSKDPKHIDPSVIHRI